MVGFYECAFGIFPFVVFGMNGKINKFIKRQWESLRNRVMGGKMSEESFRLTPKSHNNTTTTTNLTTTTTTAHYSVSKAQKQLRVDIDEEEEGEGGGIGLKKLTWGPDDEKSSTTDIELRVMNEHSEII